jgi:hypothetical protein
MKIMFNGLDRPFELLNPRYGREARELLCFAKHHSLTIYISCKPLENIGNLQVQQEKESSPYLGYFIKPRRV